jgi:hypothetical protein
MTRGKFVFYFPSYAALGMDNGQLQHIKAQKSNRRHYSDDSTIMSAERSPSENSTSRKHTFLKQRWKSFSSPPSRSGKMNGAREKVIEPEFIRYLREKRTWREHTKRWQLKMSQLNHLQPSKQELQSCSESEQEEMERIGIESLCLVGGSDSTVQKWPESTSSSSSPLLEEDGRRIPQTLEEAAALIPNLPIQSRRGRRSKSEIEAISMLQKKNPELAEELLRPARLKKKKARLQKKEVISNTLGKAISSEIDHEVHLRDIESFFAYESSSEDIVPPRLFSSSPSASLLEEPAMVLRRRSHKNLDDAIISNEMTFQKLNRIFRAQKPTVHSTPASRPKRLLSEEYSDDEIHYRVSSSTQGERSSPMGVSSRRPNPSSIQQPSSSPFNLSTMIMEMSSSSLMLPSSTLEMQEEVFPELWFPTSSDDWLH